MWSVDVAILKQIGLAHLPQHSDGTNRAAWCHSVFFICCLLAHWSHRPGTVITLGLENTSGAASRIRMTDLWGWFQFFFFREKTVPLIFSSEAMTLQKKGGEKQMQGCRKRGRADARKEQQLPAVCQFSPPGLLVAGSTCISIASKNQLPQYFYFMQVAFALKWGKKKKKVIFSRAQMV